MLAQLIPVDGSQPFVITRDVTVVGRRRQDCDMVLNHHGVSKLHCAIAKTDGLLFVRDLGSTNGTKVNGQRVMRGALLPGDELAFGSTKFRVHLGPGDESGITDKTEAMAAYMPPPGREHPLVELQERLDSDSDIRLVPPEEVESNEQRWRREVGVRAVESTFGSGAATIATMLTSKQDYRAEFPVTREWAFLNHAAVAPLSRRAHDRILEWAADFANHGNVREADWYREVETVRSAAARLLGATSEEVAFLKNTSEGLALVAEGLDLQPGDSVVMVGREFPANVYPWLHLQSRGIDVRSVQPAEQGRIALDDLAAAMNSTTRLLSISFVQYANGYRSDLAALGQLCRDRNVLLCVDAIQGLGVLPVDVEAMQIDFLAADGHKWLVSPEGAAIFYCRRALLDRLRPVSVGWKSVANYGSFAEIDFRFPPTAARFECGSLNVAGIVAMGASIQLLDEVGAEEIERRVFTVTDELVQRLTAAGATVYSSRRPGEWSGIVSFEWPEGEPRRLKLACLKQQVMISYRDGRLRASPHFYSDTSDIDALLAALQSGMQT